jgi:hypothetical protein
MKNTNLECSLTALTMLTAAAFLAPDTAQAHCDTLDGPVVLTAKAALEKGDATPVLKWVKVEDEAEIRAAFKKTLAVRTKGDDARQLADQFFFETLVRVHRAGEGEPFTGIKPAGTAIEPIVRAADEALERGSVDKLVREVADEAAAGIRKRFAEASEKRKHADQNVEAGREYVAAYVEYVHFVERLHETATTSAHHEESAEPAPQHKH